MFARVKKIGGNEYLYLVENVREGGRHVQRVIKALGRRDDVEDSNLLDGLIASAARHSSLSLKVMVSLKVSRSGNRGYGFGCGAGRHRSGARVNRASGYDPGEAASTTRMTGAGLSRMTGQAFVNSATIAMRQVARFCW